MTEQYEEYREAYDRHACLETLCKETAAELTKVIADATTGLSMMKEECKITGKEISDAGQTILMIESLSELQTCSFKDAQLSIKTATLGMAKLCLFMKVETSQEDVAEAQEELTKGIWYANQASKEVQALRALFKDEVAALYELLKL